MEYPNLHMDYLPVCFPSLYGKNPDIAPNLLSVRRPYEGIIRFFFFLLLTKGLLGSLIVIPVAVTPNSDRYDFESSPG